MADNKKEQAFPELTNVVEVTGYLKENGLEEVDSEITLKDNGGKMKTTAIRGELIVRAEDKDIRISVYQKAHTKTGKPNGIYKGYRKVLNEYVSKVDVVKKYGDSYVEEHMSEVTVVDLNGKSGCELAENAYPHKETGKLVINDKIKTTFINSTDRKYTPRAEFVLEGYFNKINEEIDKEQEETGRVVVEMIIPAYGGKVFPITLIAPSGEIADHMLNEYEVGRTGKVWGELDYISTEEKKVKKGFGKDKVEIITNFKKELIITGGEEDQYEDDDKKTMKKSLVKKAMNERQIWLDEMKNKGASGNKAGFNSKKSTKKAKDGKLDDEDIPF